MAKDKPKLPAECHDDFRRANLHHKECSKSLANAAEDALKTGRALLAAKARIPHGRWETECARLFDGSLRTARFYMQFSKDFDALPKTAKSAVLFLEGSISGAAKAAKEAANPKPEAPVNEAVAEPEPEPEMPDDFEPDDDPSWTPPAEDAPANDAPGFAPTESTNLDECPNCRGLKWVNGPDGWRCKKCNHPHGEPAGDRDPDGEHIKTLSKKAIKTIEALERCFDDLHHVDEDQANYDYANDLCDKLRGVAEGWA